MFDSRLRHSFAMLETFKERFSDLLFDTIIHINVKLKESAVMGKTVAHYDKYSRGSKDYYSLSKELILSEKSCEEVKEKDVQEPVEPTIEDSREKEFQPLSSRMREILLKEAKELFPTRFSYVAPGAKSVFVTGSFNDWSLDDHCRLKENGGTWVVDIPLEAGVYKYQFIVDGVWREDPNNPRKERNSFGDINSLVEVKGVDQ